MLQNSVILGTGSYLPEKKVTNEHFLSSTFHYADGRPMTKANDLIIEKLRQISGIQERRYVEDNHDTAQMAVIAAERAIEQARIDKELIDGIILAHNFGNIPPGETQGHLIPNLAAIAKGGIGIQRPDCFAFDILYGCPGWLQALVLAHQHLVTDQLKHVLVIGVEVITRITDPHDLDSMLFGDGAGAVILSREESETKRGILTYQAFSHCNGELEFLKMGDSYQEKEEGLHPKMQGKKVYRYAVQQLPILVSNCLEKANIPLADVSKFLFHQANEKMILAIADKLFRRHNLEGDLKQLVPLTINYTGNSSVATIPTLLDFILRKELPPHEINTGDVVVMGSVGAGMHANSMVYKF